MHLRPIALLVALLACMAVSACQGHDADSDRDRDQQHGGFYGGVTGGAAHP